MSLVQPAVPDRRHSPAPPALDLSSNNPFRNRAVSPAVPSPRSATFRSSNEQSRSKNPYLNPFADENSPINPPEKNMATEAAAPPSGIFATDLFRADGDMDSRFHRFVALFADYPKPQNDLSLLDGPAPNPNTNDISGSAFPPRAVAPPPRSGTMPAPAHRPSRSREEEEARRRAPPRPRGPPPTFGQPDVFASPPKSENRRPRRNSESSIIDSKEKAEEERRRRERRKERELRLAREGRDGKDAKEDTKQDVKVDAKQDAKGKPTKRPQGLDLIDKLDVTGIYGQG
ncbi:hypothetical protein LTR28_006994, partial [Elasticomyces elasticus]